MKLPLCRFRMWICLSRERRSDVRQIHNAQAGWAGGGGVLNGGGEETGQMNSTCRGEGEGLNCKTRRQRSCALKACRHKRCVVGGEGGEERLVGVCTLGEGLPTASPSTPPPECRATAREAGATSWGGCRSARTAAKRQINRQKHQKQGPRKHRNVAKQK